MRQASRPSGNSALGERVGEGALSGAACALALAALVAAAPAGADDAVIDGIAAQVGTDIVLVSEVTQPARARRGKIARSRARPRARSRSCAPTLSSV